MPTDFQVPRITSEKVDDRRGTFTVEPLDKGFGYTFGNSLRRVLLSSLGGAAVTSVRIEGVAHEFSTVPGVKEDVTDIVLNLKSLAIFTDADRVEELTAREPVPTHSADILPGPVGEGVASSNGLDEILIEELELGVRSYNCLKRAGVQTVGDLVRKTRSELNAIPNFGSKSIDEVIETLQSRGLDLQAD